MSEWEGLEREIRREKLIVLYSMSELLWRAIKEDMWCACLASVCMYTRMCSLSHAHVLHVCPQMNNVGIFSAVTILYDLNIICAG